MRALAEACPVDVANADDLGWRGDAIEAEAFAYLAARCLRGLPISFPGTTGAPQPMTGGRIAHPA
jgi:anhydro-N-acetylmuramic acid kinase